MSEGIITEVMIIMWKKVIILKIQTNTCLNKALPRKIVCE
jgi:hypothetical protein